MTTFKLNSKNIEELADLPETGMGYQQVYVYLKNGEKIDGFVHNCEYLEISNEYDVMLKDVDRIIVRRRM